jgi:hypothetical protein
LLIIHPASSSVTLKAKTHNMLLWSIEMLLLEFIDGSHS